MVVAVVEKEEEGMGKGGRVSWSWRFYHKTTRIEIRCVLSANKMARMARWIGRDLEEK